MPDHWFVRRDVHREHDGRRGRGDRPLAPGRRLPPAVDYRREVFARESGIRAAELVAAGGPLPRDILTKEAFENAITVVMALAGSTNAVLHLLAIAREAGVDLELDDFDRVSRATPHLVDVRPAGKFVMSDLDRVGGVPVVMQELLDAGMLHGDCMTVTGKTQAENLPRSRAPEARRRHRASRSASRSTPGAGSRSSEATSLRTVPS